MPAPWSNDIPACVMTWITLVTLEQSSKAFPRSGDVKMRNLAFWAGSDDLRGVRAKALAIQIDGVFLSIFGSKREEGRTKRKAIRDVTDQLLVGNGTIAELAEVNDGNYLFLGEEAS